MEASGGRIRVGIGGWTFAPWRGVFYPRGLRQKDELAFTSQRLGVIEINATYHSLQSAESFDRWAKETPDDFVFTIKGSRFVSNRRRLANAKEGLARFLAQGLGALGSKLGPILWQLMATKVFDCEDMARFLDLLPDSVEGLPLRHAIEPRHRSFAEPAFLSLCAERGVAICLSDDERWPLIEAAGNPFIYARLLRSRSEEASGYAPGDLDRWAGRFMAQARAGRDVFAFFIGGAKEKAPAAALALMDRVSTSP
ncbi:MAG: DUF72 domain-containing protein [Caulobacteraceae bacterium]